MSEWPGLQHTHHVHTQGDLFGPDLSSPLVQQGQVLCTEDDAEEQQGGLLPLKESRSRGVARTWSWVGVAGQAPVSREAQRRRPATGIVGGA